MDFQDFEHCSMNQWLFYQLFCGDQGGPLRLFPNGRSSDSAQEMLTPLLKQMEALKFGRPVPGPKKLPEFRSLLMNESCGLRKSWKLGKFHHDLTSRPKPIDDG